MNQEGVELANTIISNNSPTGERDIDGDPNFESIRNLKERTGVKAPAQPAP